MLTEKNKNAILSFAKRNFCDPQIEYDGLGNYLIKRGYFETLCYKQFTVKELISYLEKNPQYDIVTGTLMLRQKALRFADRAKLHSEPAHLFSTMYDVLSEILDFLLSRKGVN